MIDDDLIKRVTFFPFFKIQSRKIFFFNEVGRENDYAVVAMACGKNVGRKLKSIVIKESVAAMS